MWYTDNIRDLDVTDILHQAAPWCLEKINNWDLTEEWTAHLASLEKYEDEVRATGWRNPIVVWRASPNQITSCDSHQAYTNQTYVPALGWNRLYWSVVWKLPTITAIVADNKLEAFGYRSIMEAFKKVERFGIERLEDDLIIPTKKRIVYGLDYVRQPQWILPRFKIPSHRIVEKFRGDFDEVTGIHNVIRPMPGARTETSCFYIIAGNKPSGDTYECSFIPEGWIGMEEAESKYREMFREWE